MGSLEFLERAFEKISKGEGFGSILAQGVARAAPMLGTASEQIANAARPFPYGQRYSCSQPFYMRLSPVPW